MGGTVVNNLMYADDSVILSGSEEQLQRLINVVVVKSVANGLHLNSAKSFSMVFSKSITTPTSSTSFIYLVSLFSSDARKTD